MAPPCSGGAKLDPCNTLGMDERLIRYRSDLPHWRLTGSIYRNFSSRRDVTYRAGVPNYQPSSAYDYWSGSLQLSWQL